MTLVIWSYPEQGYNSATRHFVWLVRSLGTVSHQWRRNEFESGAPEIFLGRAPPLFGLKALSRFGERFRNGQYSSVSFLFDALLDYSRCSRAPVPHGVGAAIYHLTFVRHRHYQRSKTCSRRICSHVPTSLTITVSRVRAANIVRRPCSDSNHVTAPYKLSFYYYLLLILG